jgi:hypothetical protein
MGNAIPAPPFSGCRRYLLRQELEAIVIDMLEAGAKR